MTDACRHARLAIGGEPRSLPAEVQQHVAECAACARFRDETLGLETRLRAALELPLQEFRAPALRRPPARRFALAASVLLALLAGGGFWLLRPQTALAEEIVEHLIHEPGSWEQRQELGAAELAAVLEAAGVEFDSSLPVVYAAPCPFRGRRVSHLVVQSAQGPMTVMLLPHVRVASREAFDEHGYQGLLLPAGAGSVAVILRDGPVPAATAERLVSEVRWR
jgi:hypothetical protein